MLVRGGVAAGDGRGVGDPVSAIVWSCPECQADLVDTGFNLWCPVCERYWSFTLFMGDDDE